MRACGGRGSDRRAPPARPPGPETDVAPPPQTHTQKNEKSDRASQGRFLDEAHGVVRVVERVLVGHRLAEPSQDRVRHHLFGENRVRTARPRTGCEYATDAQTRWPPSATHATQPHAPPNQQLRTKQNNNNKLTVLVYFR